MRKAGISTSSYGAEFATAVEPVRLWTVQPESVWLQVERRGRLTVDPQYCRNVHPCYEWLREQLTQRLPGYAGHFPWWAYCDRPDLRVVRHQKHAPQVYYLLELRVPGDRVFVFPFWAWNLIFGGRFLAVDPSESAAFQRRLELAVPDWDDRPTWPEPWESDLRRSWERLFDPSLPGDAWRTDPSVHRGSHSRHEAVFERLDRDHVVRVTRFIGARRSE